ncbi:MAG: DUF1175 family protein [Bryobacterales bacterium]|nr:DUF1175 family protein [Bryobacterales bacterium]
MKRWSIWMGLAIAACVPLGWLLLTADHGSAISLEEDRLRADGISRVELVLPRGANGGETTIYRLEAGPGVARLLQLRKETRRDVAVIQTGVVGGLCRLVATQPSGEPGVALATVASLDVRPDWRDRNGDGFPDSLHLDSAADRRAFLDWFRYLAEEQFYRGDELDPEIGDCAALLRFGYREALRKHDGEWANRIGLRAIKPIPGVQKYQYPFTPLKADLFRLRPGPFQPDDLTTGAFGQFADAENLLLYNTSRIGKDIEQAQPGDLLFYRQEAQGMPFHAMVFLGRSMMQEEDPSEYVVYHTGPEGSWPGEMRRRTVLELRRHPEARWHPVAANPAFLGVYRWKIVVAGGGA